MFLSQVCKFVDDDSVDEFSPSLRGSWRGYCRNTPPSLPYKGRNIESLRQSITKAESILPTTASPPPFRLGDFYAGVFWESSSFPEFRNPHSEIFHESFFHLMDFCLWVFFLFCLLFSVFCFFDMFLYPGFFALDKTLDEIYRIESGSTNNECTRPIYLDSQCTTGWTDKGVVHYAMRCDMSILVPIPMSMSPPIISAFFPICSHHFLPNSIPMNDVIKVTTPIQRAGRNISSVVAVRDTPTASASILVAIPRMMSDLSPKMFLVVTSSSSHLYPSYAILAPIYPRSPNAIQWSYLSIVAANILATPNPMIGIIAWKNPKENAIFMASWVRIFFSDIPVPTDTANASADTESARRSVVMRLMEYVDYLPRPAARPGRCLFGGLNAVAHLPNLLAPAHPNRDTLGPVGGIRLISAVSVSGVCSSSSRSVSGVVIVWVLVGSDYRKIGHFRKWTIFFSLGPWRYDDHLVRICSVTEVISSRTASVDFRAPHRRRDVVGGQVGGT